jgi:hypothetical protein
MLMSFAEMTAPFTRPWLSLIFRRGACSVHDGCAAVHTSASAGEGDIRTGAKDVEEDILGLHAARYADLGP